MRVEWLYEARCEFRELLAYYRAAAGAEAARELSDRVLSAVEALADAPRAGVLRREGVLGRHGFRTLSVDRYACIYRVEEGVVRVYHLTDGSRDGLFELLGVREREAGTACRLMPLRGVFLRAALRQPVKTALLAAVMALVVFAFVSRAAEYLLVCGETDRLGALYRTVGTLEAGEPWADMGPAEAWLEANPSVQSVNTYHYVSAVMEEVCNADTDLLTSDMNRYIAFYGTLWSYGDDYFHFIVDEVAAGRPELIYEDYSVILHTTRDGTDPEAARGQLVKGERYLAVGYYSLLSPSRIEYDEKTGRQTATHALLSCPLEDGYFYPVPEGGEVDWSDPRLGDLGAFLQDVRSEQHALNVIPTQDMSALPQVQEADPSLYLTEGRWLDSRDNGAERRTCVISQSLAELRGLSVGDTLTLTLRDVPSTFGYFHPYPIRGPLLFSPPEGFDAADLFSSTLTADTRDRWVSPGPVETAADAYEIVGLYEYRDKYQRTVVSNFAYIPASAVPESFAMTTADTLGPLELTRMELLADYISFSSPLPVPGAVSFVLTSPEEGARFMTEARSELEALGFRASLLENGWAAFQAAAQPLRRSTLYNAAIFSAVLAAALCLLALVHFRMRGRDMAIARALGVPAAQCTGEAALPLILTGLLGAVLGGGLGWRNALNSAGATLAGLSEYGAGGAAALPVRWLAALLGAVLVLLLAAAVGGGAYLSTRPVIFLLQGGRRTGGQKAAGPCREDQSGTAVPRVPLPAPAALPADALPAGGPHAAAVHVLRFVWRHICRARLKSALALALAAGFMVGLAAIRLSIAGSRERIDWLYENTSVEAELVLRDAGQSRSGGFLRRDVADRLLASGCITRAYIEGASQGALVRYDPALEERGGSYITREMQIRKAVRAFDDEAMFLTTAGSGGAVAITYLDGWDGALFARDWSGEGLFPVVVPKEVYDQSISGPDGTVGLVCKSFRMCQVAGYYTGSVAGESGETDPVLLPLSAYQSMCGSRMAAYGKIHVTLDPSLNRDLEQFQSLLAGAAAEQSGTAALRAVIWDEELRMAVAPLENSVELMEVLYPVTFGMSLLAAAGIAVLFVMTSAREAAILRVLGTSRLRSRIMLALQTALTSLAGLLLGLAGALAHTAWTRPELLAGLASASVLCAVLYLLAAIAGAVLSAVSVTARNPLELLQVRE